MSDPCIAQPTPSPKSHGKVAQDALARGTREGMEVAYLLYFGAKLDFP